MKSKQSVKKSKSTTTKSNATKKQPNNIEQLSPIDQYYLDIKNKALKLIEKKLFKEAEDLLIDELEAPYIPQKTYEELEEVLTTLRAEIYYLQGLVDLEKFNKPQLLDQILNNNKINTDALHLFFERYKDNLVQDDLDFFEDVLTHKKINNFEKELVFEMIMGSKIETGFKYHNNNLKEDYVISTKDTKTFFQIELYQKTEAVINEMAEKEPSLLNFCQEILFAIYKYYFPTVPNFEAKQLAHSIFAFMLSALQGEQVQSNEIIEVIKKITSENFK